MSTARHATQTAVAVGSQLINDRTLPNNTPCPRYQRSPQAAEHRTSHRGTLVTGTQFLYVRR